MKFTKHGRGRKQQRCIQPEVIRWLHQYGEEVYLGNGVYRFHFSKRSVKAMRRAMGRDFVQKNKKYLDAYIVEAYDGPIITAGWKTRKFRVYH